MERNSQLVDAFSKHPLGLCGQHDPARVVSDVEDLEQRLNILALGSILDINPLSEERWTQLIQLKDSWLMDPGQVAYRSSQEVGTTMEQTDLIAPRHIPRVWWQVARGVQGRFNGSWMGLILTNRENARILGRYLLENRTTFPVLAGPVVSVRWMDLVHRIGNIKLKDWENLRLPIQERQKKMARLVGIEQDEVHPLTSYALHVWGTACQRLPNSNCGFEDCPRR